MSISSPYTISTLATPVTEGNIIQYKQLRLSGLLTEPQFFGSNFEREAAFTPDVWRTRLDTPGKATFIASIPIEAQPFDHAAGYEHPGSGSGEQWVGTVTVLGPTFLEELYDDDDLFELRNRSLYTIVAVWVEPAFRRKGIAGRLMQAALSWIQEDTQHGRGDTPKAVVLRVHRTNVAAREVYLRRGFQDLATTTGNGHATDEIWMLHHLYPSPPDAHHHIGSTTSP